MASPRLDGAQIKSIAQHRGDEGPAQLMESELLTLPVIAFTSIAFAAVQFGSLRQGLQRSQHLPVRRSSFRAKDE